MQDAITMDTGNSRYMKSVSGLLELCPTYKDFVSLLVSGEFPFDLAGKNPDGWAQQGTPLNKANLLTDATAAMAGLGSDATVNDMLATLAGKTQEMENRITYGTTDLTAGSSPLPTGTVYLVYK